MKNLEIACALDFETERPAYYIPYRWTENNIDDIDDLYNWFVLDCTNAFIESIGNLNDHRICGVRIA